VILEKGQEINLADYKGKVVLVVNTASKCGFTPQYAGLEKLYKDIKEKHGDDFVILGFPCNRTLSSPNGGGNLGTALKDLVKLTPVRRVRQPGTRHR
jgi:glutathione peroxidase-family protein